MFKKLFKEEKGFTMIELIIVIAIIGIIGAIVAPNFTSTTTKAKVKADVASVREISRQITLYMAETGAYPEDDQTTTPETDESDAAYAGGGLQVLVDAKYLAELPKPQTKGLEFIYTESTGKVQIGTGTGTNAPDDDVKAAVNALEDTPEEELFEDALPWS